MKKTKRIHIGLPAYVKNDFIEQAWRASAEVDYNRIPTRVACEVLRQMLERYVADDLWQDLRNSNRKYGDDALAVGFDGDNCILSMSITPKLHAAISKRCRSENKRMTQLCREIIVNYLNGKYGH